MEEAEAEEAEEALAKAEVSEDRGIERSVEEPQLTAEETQPELTAGAGVSTAGPTLTIDGPGSESITLRVGDAVLARYEASQCGTTEIKLQLWQCTEWYTGRIRSIDIAVRPLHA